MEIKHTIRFILIMIISLFGFSSQAQMSGEIRISDLELQLRNDKLYINWSADEGETTNYFEIEKSRDGKVYRTMAYVLGPDPSKSGSRFGYFDKADNSKGTTYYRVKHIDKEGHVSYSSVKTATL